jgi:quercetin dioxygenase-like cupin family protein
VIHTEPLVWNDNTDSPLNELLRFCDPNADTIVVGTGHFRAGQVMPASGFSQYPMREISFILEGELETECDGRRVRLGAGELITIPPDSCQRTTFIKDTKLVYLFFGNDSDVGSPGGDSGTSTAA